jgi:hypothetical protein
LGKIKRNNITNENFIMKTKLISVRRKLFSSIFWSLHSPIDNLVSESTYNPVEGYIYEQIKDKVNNSIRLVRISKL